RDEDERPKNLTQRLRRSLRLNAGVSALEREEDGYEDEQRPPVVDLPPEIVLDQEDEAEADEGDSRDPRAVPIRMPDWRSVAHEVILVRFGLTAPLRREELTEQPLDFVAQQWVEPPARAVVRPRCIEELRVGSHRTSFLVGRSEDHQGDTSEDGRARVSAPANGDPLCGRSFICRGSGPRRPAAQRAPPVYPRRRWCPCS